MSIESDVGALDEEKVEATFKRVAPGLMDCYGRGSHMLPYLFGEVRFAVRVNQRGEANLVYVKDSTLGDRSTEECMVSLLRSARWPAPVGGKEGFAENAFTFEPGNDERPPVDLTEEHLGDPYQKEGKEALSRCRAEAGSGPIKATFYIDTEGKPVSAGASSEDERGERAIPCVLTELRELTFPSPGSYAGKVTVTIE